MDEKGKRFANTTPNNFRDILYTAIHHEVMQLQICRSKKERESIRLFLIKAFELSGYNIKNQNCGRDKNGAFHCECGKCKTLLSKTKQNHSPVIDLIQRTTTEESTYVQAKHYIPIHSPYSVHNRIAIDTIEISKEVNPNEPCYHPRTKNGKTRRH